MGNWTKRNTLEMNANAKEIAVTYLGGYTFKVTSQQTDHAPYVVVLNAALNGGSCTCQWGSMSTRSVKVAKKTVCKHVLKALDWAARQNERTSRGYAAKADADRQHRVEMGTSQGVWIVTRKKGC